MSYFRSIDSVAREYCFSDVKVLIELLTSGQAHRSWKLVIERTQCMASNGSWVLREENEKMFRAFRCDECKKYVSADNCTREAMHDLTGRVCCICNGCNEKLTG